MKHAKIIERLKQIEHCGHVPRVELSIASDTSLSIRVYASDGQDEILFYPQGETVKDALDDAEEKLIRRYRARETAFASGM